VDLEVAMVENVLLRPTYELMPAPQLGPRIAASLGQDTPIRMAYGRLAVDAQRFLREALLVTLRPTPGGPPAATSGGLFVTLSREVFRAQIGSDRAKRARWYAETVAGPKTSSGIARATASSTSRWRTWPAGIGRAPTSSTSTSCPRRVSSPFWWRAGR
jgi:hypothetical protein